VDASVVLKWFLPETENQEAEDLLLAFLAGKASLYAPDLLLVETASALWRRSVVRQEACSADVKAIYRDLLTLPLNFQPSDRLAAAALSLALLHRHSVYDSFYFALAVEMDCEFLTADRTLVLKLAEGLPYVRHISKIKL
jgi:predicted nucleic acid-binding protein